MTGASPATRRGDPGALLPSRAIPRQRRSERCAAWNWPQAWEALRDALGYVVDEAVVDLHLDGTGRVRETLLLAGARVLDPGLAGRAQLNSMMRVACLASPRVDRARPQ